MICQRCMLRLSRRQGLQHALPIRTFTTSRRRSQTPVTAQDTTATNPRPSDLPAATSTSAAQPFSTPLSPSPERQHDGQSKSEAAAPIVRSTVPAGTVLKGLNFMKNKPDPIAMEDHEYPDWLWTVLEPKKDDSLTGAVDGEGDLFCMSPNTFKNASGSRAREPLALCSFNAHLLTSPSPPSKIKKAAQSGSQGPPSQTSARPRLAHPQGAPRGADRGSAGR